MDLLFRNFFLKSPPVGRFEVVEPLIPPHNLIPPLRVHLPPFWGVLGTLWTIFRSGSRWEMDVLYHVPLTFTQIPVRGWRIHHLWAWLWTGFTHVTPRDTRGRYLSYVIFPFAKNGKRFPSNLRGREQLGQTQVWDHQCTSAVETGSMIPLGI